MLDEAPGILNFTTFLAIFGERIMGGDNPDVIKKAFAAFDPEGTGMVNEDELRKQLTKFGEKMTEDEFDAAMAEARVDGKGRFNIDSYVRLITGQAQEDD